jgi:hypothetical protein
MRNSVRVASWAVYQVTIQGAPGPNVVCSQGEWDAIEQAQPGLHRLVRGGITSEGEAERLARGTSGDSKPAPCKKLIRDVLGGLPRLVTEPAEGAARSEVQQDGGPLILPFSALPQESNDSPDERVESA